MRYVGEMGKEFQGDVPTAMEKQGLARILVQQCLETIKYNGGSGFATKQQMTADGCTVKATVISNIENFPPLVRVLVYAPEKPEDIAEDSGWQYIFLGAVWQPEGLMITPNSKSAPYGYGFPKRHRTTGKRINPPWGTKITDPYQICLDQCLFNKYANNKYLDHPDYISGLEDFFDDLPDNPRLRNSVTDAVPDSGLLFYRPWPFCYNPLTSPEFDNSFWLENRYQYIDDPGLNISPVLGEGFFPFKTEGTEDDYRPLARQYADNERQSKIFEQPTDQWFCHWPEECLYENAAFEAVFQECNRLRANVGELPLTRPIRGMPNGAWLTTIEMQRAKIQFHNNEEKYRPGYGLVESRWRACGITQGGGLGENLLSSPDDNLSSAETGIRINSWWEGSPLHYSNIIDPGWSYPKSGTILDVGGGIPTITTEKGDPYPNVYDPPIRGTAYAQWFVKTAPYGWWLWAGLVHNNTPYGRVSTRSTWSWCGSTIYGLYRNMIFFGGRFFQIGNIKDKDAAIIGATLFLGEDERPWFRAMTISYVGNTTLTVYVSPLGNSDKADMWIEEATITAEALTGKPIANSMTTASFNYEGTIAKLAISYPTDEYAALWFPTKDSDSAINRNTTALATLTYANKEFTISRIQAPDLEFDYETRYDSSTEKYYCTMYSQTCKGYYEGYHFFNKNNEVDHLTYNINLECVQYEEDPSTFFSNDTLTFPSGKKYDINKYDLVGGFPKEGTECFFIAFLYLDPVYEDVVYARFDIRRVTYNVYITLSFWYNDTVIRSYPEQLIANTSYGTEDPEIRSVYGYSATTNGWRDFNSANNRLSGLYDLSLLRWCIAGPTHVQPLPRTVSVSEGYFCRGSGVVIYGGKPCVGSHPVSFKPRYAFGSECRYSNKKPYTHEWSYVTSIPVCTTTFDENPDLFDDKATCEFARYEDRVVLSIHFTQLWGVQSRDEEGEVKPNGEYIIWSNFNLDDEVGIGQLTSVAPLGVI